MRVGLASFTMQCILLALARNPYHLFLCAVLAIPGNLVYPSISSLVSSSVQPEMVGRALGAVNGVKSLTEGIGPLLFGMLLTMSEKDALPGWPVRDLLFSPCYPTHFPLFSRYFVVVSLV